MFLPIFISSFPNADIFVKMEKYVTVLASVVTEFNQRFQGFAAIKDMNLFSNLFSVDVGGIQEGVQSELIAAAPTVSSTVWQSSDFLR